MIDPNNWDFVDWYAVLKYLISTLETVLRAADLLREAMGLSGKLLPPAVEITLMGANFLLEILRAAGAL
jgi:hypothetical protein